MEETIKYSHISQSLQNTSVCADWEAFQKTMEIINTILVGLEKFKPVVGDNLRQATQGSPVDVELAAQNITKSALHTITTNEEMLYVKLNVRMNTLIEFKKH